MKIGCTIVTHYNLLAYLLKRIQGIHDKAARVITNNLPWEKIAHLDKIKIGNCKNQNSI